MADAALGVLGFATLVALLIAIVAWRRATTRIARGNRRRQRQAKRAEGAAEHLLQDLGYEIVDRQVWQTWTMAVDGEEVEVGCRADLIVRRGDQAYVAEVKTGALAPEPTRAATRRQLLEYWIVFPHHGILLVDMERRSIREVTFPQLEGAP